MGNWLFNLLHGKLPGKGFLGRSSTGSGPGELLEPADARALLGNHYSVTFDNTDLVSGVLTVTHNLGEQYPSNITVYDNNDNPIVSPDEIDATSTTAMDIDLSSFGTLTGTWRVSITI
jgi:hypothetical protein